MMISILPWQCRLSLQSAARAPDFAPNSRGPGKIQGPYSPEESMILLKDNCRGEWGCRPRVFFCCTGTVILGAEVRACVEEKNKERNW